MKRQPGEHGLGYGAVAELYDRFRPSYPGEVVADIYELAKPSWMIDAGSGTGKAAVLFADHGIPGVAIEGDPAMAEVARRRLAGRASWRVDVSRFEDWVPAPGDPPVDLMACAQAFHWFDPATRYQKAAALIREGGWLTLIYNGPAQFDSPARQAINAAYDREAPEFERRGVAGGPGVAGAGERLKHPLFPKLVKKTYEWSKTYTAEEWTSLMRTQSDHIALAPDRREALMEAVAGAIEANGNAYEHPYLCHVFALQRSSRLPQRSPDFAARS